MKKIFEFEIPFIVPSLNVLNNWHWAKRKKEKDKFKLFCKLETTKARSTNETLCVNYQLEKKKRKVVVTRYSPRELDQDNLEGSTKKIILDCIKSKQRQKIKYGKKHQWIVFYDYGLIWDDSPEFVNCIAKQKKSKEKKTKVEVFE